MSTALYNFGLSQEDPATEARALELCDTDRVLSVASAGDMPLSLLALGAGCVHAVDIEPSQLELMRLKLAATCALEPEEAMRFLGFVPADADRRWRWLEHVSEQLSPRSVWFWASHRRAVEGGAIWAGRFERYIRRFAPLLLALLGRRHVEALFRCATLEEQREVFERVLAGRRVRWLFEIAFHPRLFRKRGMDPRSLQHRRSAQSLGEQYFLTFRQLCTATPARQNPLLQLFLFGRVLGPDAAPIYLRPAGAEAVRQRSHDLHSHQADLVSWIQRCEPGAFNKAHLSNLPDWLDQAEFEAALRAICHHCERPGRMVWRYLHVDRAVPDELAGQIRVERELGETLRRDDCFPFYGIVPASLADELPP